MKYFGRRIEEELDLLSANASIWQFINAADEVKLIQNEHTVKVWKVSKEKYHAIVKYLTSARANEALEQIASEHRAATLLSNNRPRSALLVLTVQTILVPEVGAFSISPYAGESVAKMRRTTWRNCSVDELERLCQKLAISLLMAQQEYQKQAQQLGGSSLLHKDLKPANVCYVEDETNQDRDFFRPINYGSMSTVDKNWWVNVKDIRYIDPQMAQYHADVGMHAAQYEDGLRCTTFPSTDIYLTGLTVAATYLGRLPQEIDYYLYDGDEAAYFEAVHKFRWKDCAELAMMPGNMQSWLLKALAFHPADRWESALAAMQDPWLDPLTNTVMPAVHRAKQAWDETVQQIKDDLRENRSCSSTGGGCISAIGGIAC